MSSHNLTSSESAPNPRHAIRLDEIEAVLRAEGLSRFGFAELKTPMSIALYDAWLDKGYQGEMAYLERHAEDKRHPQRLLDRAKSAIVIALDYVPHPEPVEAWPLSPSSKVAAYARGRDYHHLIKGILNRVVDRLRESYPDEHFVCFTDSAPVLERDLATRAGLGWVGKNTCLINKESGSLCFLAEIYTTLELPVAKFAEHSHCGTCTRCLDACPTGALISPKELDARRCISYLTIESRQIPDETLRIQMGDWLFGCDICQTVCPWNIKAHGRDTIEDLHPEKQRSELIEDLRFLLSGANRAIERAFAGTPLMRAGGWGLKRNALVVAANSRLVELEREIHALTDNEKLGELARWALKKLAEPGPI